MSNSEFCQEEIRQAVQEESSNFFRRLAYSHLHSDSLSLRASWTELSLLLAAWPAPPLRVVIVPSVSTGKRLYSYLVSWQEILSLTVNWHLVAGELTPQEVAGTVITDLSRTIHSFLQRTPSTPKHLIISPSALSSLIPALADYGAATITARVGEKNAHGLQLLVKQIIYAGYSRFDKSLEPGGVRVRGEVIDWMSPFEDCWYTITYYHDTVERIVQHTGRRSTSVDQCIIRPLALPKPTVAWRAQFQNYTVLRSHAHQTLSTRSEIIYDALLPTLTLPWRDVSAGKKIDARKRWFLLYANRDRLQAYIRQHQLQSATLCAHASGAQLPWMIESASTVIATEKALLPAIATDTSRTKTTSTEQLLGALIVGRPAVHSDHGIGIYEGLQSRLIDAQEREYLILRYAAGDTLSVPVEYAYKVTPYWSEKAPSLHRLGGVGWLKTKRKAQHDAAAFAADLLKIARSRQGKERLSYRIDADLNRQFDATFAYTLTADQERTWHEVQHDLRTSKPMDRLIVGDVGFGKTEIAQRAAWAAVENGRQVALIAPTTLLVQQHADTFKDRLPHLKARIGMLSRFVHRGQRKEVHQHIADGSIAIAIGTHALLDATIRWKNLGLVIIDEEQRFGVRHKESFKKIRAEVDILSLSATPIPRTLSLALSHLRDLSVIATPPKERKSVVTRVDKEENTRIKETLLKELARKGQIYAVTPRIADIAPLVRRIHALVPRARVGVAHGQMDDKALATVMEKFDQGNLDILVSSTIIENGLDLPNANTIIIFSATRLGLADLYQLRGRVGRRATQGYALFLYNHNDLTPIQRLRLTALTEATRLGSGWELAQRDLEIRGSGNVLGKEQSGTVAAVGLQLYLDLIQEAVESTPPQSARRDVDIQLPLPAVLPTHYIHNLDERTRWYIRLSRARTIPALEALTDEMKRTFGPPPPPTRTLLLMLRLQHYCAQQGISKISSQHITPPNKPAITRLTIEANDPLSLLKRLHELGKWSVRHNTLTLPTPAITTQLIEELSGCLAN